jgi:hypothetical protein
MKPKLWPVLSREVTQHRPESRNYSSSDSFRYGIMARFLVQTIIWKRAIAIRGRIDFQLRECCIGWAGEEATIYQYSR